MEYISKSEALQRLSEATSSFLDKSLPFFDIWSQSQEKFNDLNRRIESAFVLASTGNISYEAPFKYVQNEMSIDAFLAVSDHVLLNRKPQKDLLIPFLGIPVQKLFFTICRIDSVEEDQIVIEQKFPESKRLRFKLDDFYILLEKAQLLFEYANLFSFSRDRIRQTQRAMSSIASGYFSPFANLYEVLESNDIFAAFESNLHDSMLWMNYVKEFRSSDTFRSFENYIFKTIPDFFNKSARTGEIYKSFSDAQDNIADKNKNSVFSKITNFARHMGEYKVSKTKNNILKKAYALNDAASICIDLVKFTRQASLEYVQIMRPVYESCTKRLKP